jgi:hypothetical protein
MYANLAGFQFNHSLPRIAAIETKLLEILEACKSNAHGIEQLNAHV